MKNLFIPFVLAAFMVLLFSCTSDSVNDSNNPVDVYVCGSKAGHACYWKNNQLISLNDAGFSETIADTIIVENNNVYITGTEYGDYKQLYWKNNQLTDLTDTFSTPTDVVKSISSMDVENNVVYFLGVTENISTQTWDLAYWKNGVKNVVSSFSNGQFYYAHMGIKVVNNDIYIVCPNEVNGVLTPGYYVNGVFFPQTGVVNLNGCSAINDAIYIFGTGSGDSGYYKNIVTNTETSFQSSISHMAADGVNIYSSDYSNVYKNGLLFYAFPDTNQDYDYILSFKVKNNVFYALTAHVASMGYDLLRIDNATYMQSSNDEVYTDLFLVDN